MAEFHPARPKRGWDTNARKGRTYVLLCTITLSQHMEIHTCSSKYSLYTRRAPAVGLPARRSHEPRHVEAASRVCFERITHSDRGRRRWKRYRSISVGWGAQQCARDYAPVSAGKYSRPSNPARRTAPASAESAVG